MAKKIAFDFESIKNRILQDLSAKSEWASFLNYGVIDNIVSSIANEMAYQIQYSEYNSTENFWNMARNRSSLLQMSPMHGYIVPRKQASRGTVRVSTSETFDSSYNVEIQIPKFFQFSGADTYVCCSEDSIVLNANEDYVDVPCIQGEVKEVSFLAEGIQYEEKIIMDDAIDNSFFMLTVNDSPWNYVDSLFLCAPSDKSYQIRTLSNLKGITIKFGNDIFGKKLNKNDIIKFKYISTKGSQGNIYTSDVINTVESQATDANNKSIKLYCTNVSSFTGGKDYPSIEEIKETSPKVYQTGDRASSRDDYITILKQVNDISKVSVWGAYETLKDEKKDPWDFISTEENKVHIALLMNDYKSFDELDASTVKSEKIKIIEKLHDLCDPTDLITFENVSKIPMVFHVDGKIISSAYTVSEVDSYIRANLSKEYGIENMSFGENIYNSDYVRLIDETKGIDNHISHVELYEEGKFLTSDWFGTFRLPIYPIKFDSVYIEIRDISDENSKYEKMAVCDSNGNIVGSEGTQYITTGSRLNLNTGEGVLQIASLPSSYKNYELKINYQYNGENILNSKRSNILYYADSVINLTY